MPIASKYLDVLNEDGTYHIYNRTNNKEPLFRNDENKSYFLKQYGTYLSGIIHTYCWCILPNHFHLLIKVKTRKEIVDFLNNLKQLKNIEKKYLDNSLSCNDLIVNAFHRFFTSYSMSYNKMFERTGNLFQRRFKRLAITSETHFTQAIIYIHANPLKHKVTEDFTSYKWSSWQSIFSKAPTKILREEIIDWFGNEELLIRSHKDLSKYYYETNVAIEE